MIFTVWVAVLGAVLLTLALTASYLRWMPVTTSAVCLALGVAIGPAGLGLLRLGVDESSGWMEHLTEVAVVFSLFVSGLKLRLPLKNRSWRVAYGLAGPVMILTIAGLCLALHYLFGYRSTMPGMMIGCASACQGKPG
jgi:NhaP-type Na+/H+ or K+/H+ antiporter